MTIYGLTSAGFVRKHLSTIKADIEDALKAQFGNEINLTTDSVFGKIVGCVSQPIADVWEEMESVYNAMYPNTSEGTSLDNCVDLNGIVRQPTTRSEVNGYFEVVPGTTILAGSIVAVETTEDQFRTLADSTPVVTSAVKAQTSLNGSIAPGAYTITINGTPFTYTAGGGETPDQISAALAALIDAGAEPVDGIDMTGGINQAQGDPGSDGEWQAFSIAVTANLKIDTIWGSIAMESVDTGPIAAPATKLNIIVTPINNWISCTNAVSAELGDEEETDAALRIRRARSLAAAGSSTVPALLASLLDITDVEDAFVFENITDTTDGFGLPPHSFECVVLDGADQDIVDAIWANKPAGIQTYGSSSGNITDSKGVIHIIYFSRPSNINIYVTAEYKKYIAGDEEGEIFPSNGEQLIEDAILSYGATLGINNDVIAARFDGPINDACVGIKQLTIKIGTAPAPGTSTTIAIGKRELAAFAAARVTVTLV